jgi:hypothetical protein
VPFDPAAADEFVARAQITAGICDDR